MEHESTPTLSANELGPLTGESGERLRRLRSLGLIGCEVEDRFAPEDLERVRLVQFLERGESGSMRSLGPNERNRY